MYALDFLLSKLAKYVLISDLDSVHNTNTRIMSKYFFIKAQENFFNRVIFLRLSYDTHLSKLYNILKTGRLYAIMHVYAKLKGTKLLDNVKSNY